MSEVKITDYLTVSEANAYLEQYGSVEAMAEAALRGEHVEDLIAAYAYFTGTLPPWMTALEGSIPDPDEVPFLNTEEVKKTLEQLGDLFPGQQNAIDAYLAYFGNEVVERNHERQEAALDDVFGDDDSESGARVLGDYYTPNFKEILSFMLSYGDITSALMAWYSVYLRKTMNEGRETLFEILEEKTSDLDDRISDIETFDETTDQLEIAANNEYITNYRNEIQQIMSSLQTIQQVESTLFEVADTMRRQKFSLDRQLTSPLGS